MALASGDEVIDTYVAEVISRAGSGESGDRTVHFIHECPLKECCSEASWKRNKPWSCDTPDGALEMLKKHLMNSSLHALDEGEAEALLATVEVDSYVDKGAGNTSGRQVIGAVERAPGNTSGRKGAGKVGKGGRAPARAPRPRSRSRSPPRSGSPPRRHRVPILRNGVRVPPPADQSGTAPEAEVQNLQGQINTIASQVAVVARVVTNQASLLNAPARDRPATITVPARERTATISVPRGTAHLLNEALLRAVESSKQMRQSLENYEKAARQNEALIERAQQAMSNLLEEH